MKDGIYPGMSRSDYEQIEAVNWSVLKHFRRTPAHAREFMLHPPAPTESLEFGSAFHCAVLEPERFQTAYAVPPKFDRRTTIGKQGWAQWEEEHRGVECVHPDDMAAIHGMRESLLGNEIVASILSAQGKNEVAVVWTDPETGLRCKGLLDRICTYAGWTTVLDLKSTPDAGEWSFSGSFGKYQYHGQAAFYLWGLETLAPLDRQFIFAAVEKDRPHCVAVYKPDEDAILAGRAKFRRYLTQFRECQSTGIWPGYPVEICRLSVPRWEVENAA
jgi:hypothetical protein